MHGSSVFVVAFFTSVLTAAGTVCVIERYGVLEPYLHRGEKIELTEVPELKGLVEGDAREDLRAKRLSLLMKGRAPSAEGRPGTVLDQSLPPGQRVPAGGAVAVTIAEELPKVPDLGALSLAETASYVVLSQKPEAGQKVKPGAEVQLTANR